MPNYTLYYFNGRGRAEICRMLMAAADVKYTDKRFEFNEWDKYRKDMPSSCVPVLDIDGQSKMPETMAIARYLAREHGFYGKNNMDMFRVDYICDCFYEILHDYMRYFHAKHGRFMLLAVYDSKKPTLVMGGRQKPRRVNAETSVLIKIHRRLLNIYKADAVYVRKVRRWVPGFESKDKDGTEPDMKAGNMASIMQSRYMETCRRILPFLERTLEKYNGGNQFFMGDQMMLCDMMCYCCLESSMMENQSMFNNYPKLMSMWKRVAAHPKISAYLKKRSNTNW